MRFVLLNLLLILQLGAVSPLCAREKPKKPERPGPGTVVDAGTFTILVGGRRVGSETFSIRQSDQGSVASSEIRIEEASGGARQTSELRLGPGGQLRRYEWRALAPEKAEIVVEPKDEFLLERITERDKRLEQPFLMPSSSSVLDDFFFSQREILLWRYLATVCKPVSGQLQCASQKTQFGAIVPRQRASSMVSVQFVGRDQLTLHGQTLELSHFRLTDTDDWDLWLDASQKLVRILIPSLQTEVLREPDASSGKHPAPEPPKPAQ